MLSVITLNDIMNFVVLSVITLSVIMLNFVVLSVIRLSAAVPSLLLSRVHADSIRNTPAYFVPSQCQNNL